MQPDAEVEIRRLKRRLERERGARLLSEEIAETATRHSLYDSLTGLANRALFMDRLAFSLDRANRQGSSFAVLFIDLDRFKLINDSLGHESADSVLREIAGRLRRAVRPHDTVARMGGDEFTILCDDVSDRATAEAIAERITASLARPFAVLGTSVVATGSIGLILTSRSHSSPEDLLRDADAAMYDAKRRGKARYVVFDESMRGPAIERLEVERELREAIERDEFTAVYQPLVDARSGSIVGVEALLRWRHPRRGLVAPLDFIPICEETGLIVPIGHWILEQACEQVQHWREAARANRGLLLSVNLSARQLVEPALVTSVEQALARTGLDPGALCLEITEHSAMTEEPTSAANVDALVAAGVHIALDDFGKGYSSLAYLKRLPVDVLKIDSSFIDGIPASAQDGAIVAAMVALARALGLTTVAEGVETSRQHDEVRRLGCDLVQGYHFSGPLSARALGEPLALQAPGAWKPGDGWERAPSLEASASAQVAPELRRQRPVLL
jgi:diguanylate cyclase (GGDEF)-like protein